MDLAYNGRIQEIETISINATIVPNGLVPEAKHNVKNFRIRTVRRMVIELDHPDDIVLNRTKVVFNRSNTDNRKEVLVGKGFREDIPLLVDLNYFITSRTLEKIIKKVH